MQYPEKVKDPSQERNNLQFWAELERLRGLSLISKTTAPTTGDDRGDGIEVGTLWIDETNDIVYICVDNTLGAAVWDEVVPAVGALFRDDVVFPKTSGKGIKVDVSTPTFPWEDMIGEIHVKGVGANDPNWNVFMGNIRQFQFQVNDECWNEIHIPHDYLMGSHLYVHVHWCHGATTVTGGTVTWLFDITYAKGHNQQAFVTPIQTSVTASASTTQHQHIISEVQFSSGTPSGSMIDTSELEPDGILLIRTSLSANAITVSGGLAPDPFLHFIDIHYQSTGIGTKQKSPDFWT